MRSYRRNFVHGGSFFFTVNLADRKKRLLVDYIAHLKDAIRATKSAHPFTINAMVFLPDHIHALWTLPAGDTDYAKRWRLIKTQFSRGIEKTESVSPSRHGKGERGIWQRGIWQRRFWEHTIRDEDDMQNHIDYIHINPVKHGHVERASDWPHSSIHRFIREGVLSPDWACEPAALVAGEAVAWVERSDSHDLS